MKAEVERYITDAAQKAAFEVVRQQRASSQANLYRTTERLLRNYKALKRLAETPEEYCFIPPERSKSITVAPPPGGGVRDHTEAMQEAIDARKRSYDLTCAQYRQLDAVVKQFEDRPEFIVVRMYYFGEDARGNERRGKKFCSFEEISEDLALVGVQRSEKTLRTWRTRIVQDMTVVLFGIDGALSVENRTDTREEPRKEDAQ